MVLWKKTKETASNRYIRVLARWRDDETLVEMLADSLRIFPCDRARLEALIFQAGPPDPTQAVKYLPFNRQVDSAGQRTTSFSLVAMLNNRRARKFALSGRARQLSQRVFALSGNAMDIFINRIRCTPWVIELLAGAAAPVSLIGILQTDEIRRIGLLKKRFRTIRPILLIHRLQPQQRSDIDHLEDGCIIRMVKRTGLPLYRKLARRPPAAHPERA